MFKKQRDEKLANLQRENEDLMKEHQKEILQMKKLIEKQQNLLRKVTNLEKKYENELGHLKKEVMELKEKQHAKTNECIDTLISDTVLINSSDHETLIIDIYHTPTGSTHPSHASILPGFHSQMRQQTCLWVPPS